MNREGAKNAKKRKKKMQLLLRLQTHFLNKGNPIENAIFKGLSATNSVIFGE